MKKICTQAVTRCLLLLVFIGSQVKVWAYDSTTATTIDNNSSIFSQPWIWIATIVILAVTVLGPSKQTSKDIVVIRRKAVKKQRI
jgi:hypothetical protein